MSNKDLQSFMNDVYNKFFCKWRDNMPETDDAKGNDIVWKEAEALSKRYECFEEDHFRPCADIIAAFLMILDDRKRGMKGN